MKNSQLFAFIITWFSIAAFFSFFVSSESAPAVATFFLLVGVSLLGIELLHRSGTFDFILSNVHAREKSKFPDELSRTIFYIRLASRRRAYGFREVALVLREAFLTMNLGSGNFPPSWIATSSGDAAVENLLVEKNSPDLLDIFKIPEISPKEKSPSLTMSRAEYLSKLDRALTLTEERKDRQS